MQQILFDQPRGLERQQSSCDGKKGGGDTRGNTDYFCVEEMGTVLEEKLLHTGQEIMAQF